MNQTNYADTTLCQQLLTDLTNWSFSNLAITAPMDVDFADRQKVGPHILCRYHRDSLELRRILHKRRILEEEIAQISEVAKQAQVQIALQRGLAFEAYYPAGYIRQFNDLDIVVADDQQFARFLPKLVELGYYMARPAVLCRTDLGTPGGIIAFNKRRTGLDEPVMLDVSIGGPVVRPRFFWQIPDTTWQKVEYIRVRETNVPVFNASLNLIALFIEAREREKLYLRDLLDLAQIIQQPLDLAYVRYYLRYLKLEGLAARFYRRANEEGLEDLAAFVEGLTPLIARVKTTTSRDKWLMHQLERLEDNFPTFTLFLCRLLPARLVWYLGMPLYLFAASAYPGDSGLELRRGYAKIGGYRFVARLRPLMSEEEFDVQEIEQYGNSD